MTEKDWKKFGEIQYLRGRLDELFKINDLIEDVGLSGMRILDARLSKYLEKLKKCDEMSYHLYHIEKENIEFKIKKLEETKEDE